MTKEPRIYTGERIDSSINGVGKIGQPHTKEQDQTTVLYHTQKSTQNGLKNLNVRPETMKLLEGNIGSTLFDMGVINIFLNMSPQGRNKQMGVHQTKKLLHSKGNNQQKEKTIY